MHKSNRTHIDRERCTGCGLCVSVCPTLSFAVEDGKAKIVNDESLYCGHCEAVCPEGAITVDSLLCKPIKFESFSSEKKWSPYGEFDSQLLANLMMSRRSCRDYQEKPVQKSVIRDLIRFATTAPSGTNSQEWTFTVIENREKLVEFGTAVGEYYKKLNKMARNSFLRKGLSLIGQKELQFYYDSYLETVEEGINDWEKGSSDRLFHGAQAMILIGATKDASCGADDAFLATQNLLLGAHSMGVGTCLIGFVTEAMKRDRSLDRFLKLSKGEKIHSAIALGYPNESYKEVIGRKPVEPRWLS